MQILPQGSIPDNLTEAKADEIRRRLEAGWTVPRTVAGRDHWPPPLSFCPRSSAAEQPVDNRQAGGAIPSGDTNLLTYPPVAQPAEATGLRPVSCGCKSCQEDALEDEPDESAGTRC